MGRWQATWSEALGFARGGQEVDVCDRQAKFAYGGSILNSSQFSILPQKMKLALKLVKIDTKIITSLSLSKSVKRTLHLGFQK